MSDKKGYGNIGEKITADYLKKQGFIIAKANYRTRFGEIDIVAEKDNLLLVVEVKTRTEDAPISGEEAISFKKQKRIKLAAKQYLASVDYEYTVRFDAAIVTVKNSDGDEKHKYTLRYIKSAFM